MKSRPRRFSVLAIFLTVVAVSFPLQVMWLFGRAPWEPAAVANLLTPVNWMVIGLCLVSAVLALRASPWLFATVPLLTWLVVYNNWLVGRFALSYSMGVTVAGSVLFAAVIAGLVDRPMLHALLNPQSRWWLTPPRARLAVPLRLKTPTSGDFYLETFDLSEGGAFIPVRQTGAEPEAPKPQRPRSGTTRTLAPPPRPRPASDFVGNLPVGAQCYVCLPLENMNYIQCRAEVVRTTSGRGEYPAGVGIRFLGLTFQDRRMIQQFLAENQRPC